MFFRYKKGRTKDAIWSKFTLSSATGGTDKAKCSKCEYQCSTLVQRMRDHWGNCKGRKLEAKANASEHSGQSNEQGPSEPFQSKQFEYFRGKNPVP